MKDENITILHSSFICIKSNIQKTQVKVLIFVTKNARKFICTLRSDIVNSKDIQAMMIVNDKIANEILLLNIYNEKAQNAKKKQSYMIEQELAQIRLNNDQKVSAQTINKLSCNWRQRSIKAYDISNQSTSCKAQSYDQNKLLFDSIASQMTASQVKNRKLKFFALTQAKIGGETRVHQRRRKNHQFRQ